MRTFDFKKTDIERYFWSYTKYFHLRNNLIFINQINAVIIHLQTMQ